MEYISVIQFAQKYGINERTNKEINKILYISSCILLLPADPLTKQKNRLSERFFLHISKKNTNFAA